MATYVVGDVQGCAEQLQQLLAEVAFGTEDRLWLLGDLVNRGPDSAGVMRLVLAMQQQCKVVLGNHDLHFLAIHYGGHNLGPTDTMQDLLADAQVDAYADWLKRQQLLHVDEHLGCVMAHAGVPHIWSLEQAQAYAGEVSAVLDDRHPTVSASEFFQQMYGNQPDQWSNSLAGLDRVKLITNYFTRMRLTNRAGRLDFSHKGALHDAPPGWTPWYELAAGQWTEKRLLFGHWAALEGVTGFDNMLALDTGCVYGRSLSAYCMESGIWHSVAGYQADA